MLSLISNIVGYFIGSPREDFQNSEDKTDKSQRELFLDLVDSPFLVQTEKESRKQTIDGKVSHVFHGHGLIDGYIYFSSDNISGREVLQVLLYIYY